MTQEAWGPTLVETGRKAKSLFVLCQERAIPEDRLLGPLPESTFLFFAPLALGILALGIQLLGFFVPGRTRRSQ